MKLSLNIPTSLLCRPSHWKCRRSLVLAAAGLIALGSFFAPVKWATAQDAPGKESADKESADKESADKKSADTSKPTEPAADVESAQPESAKPAGEKLDFMRVREDSDGNPISFETAVRRYQLKDKSGATQLIDLIGVVHIGEKNYYEQLNEDFKSYDSLLYELVAPKGTRIPKGGREGEVTNPLAAMQNGMKSILGLEFQLDHIDYTKKNFVHADMSPAEFSQSMKKNNESFMKMLMKMMGQSLAIQGSPNAPSDAAVLMALFSNDREMRLRRIFARQFQDADVAMSMFEGDNGSTIINHRNDKALSVMEEELKKDKKTIGIFYGAGHLQDMDQKLVNKYGMTRVSERWMTAWNLSSVSASPKANDATEAKATESKAGDNAGDNGKTAAAQADAKGENTTESKSDTGASSDSQSSEKVELKKSTPSRSAPRRTLFQRLRQRRGR